MQKDKLLIGIGNRLRGDDGAGLEVAKRLKSNLGLDYDICETDGEPGKLMDLWEPYDDVIVIDAVVTGSTPLGTIHRWDVSSEALPTDHSVSSSHALGLSEAIELARVLGKLPKRIHVIGIESSSYDFTESLSPAVEGAVATIVKTLNTKEAFGNA